MEIIISQTVFMKRILGMIFISFFSGGCFVFIVDDFIGEFKGLISADPVSVSAVIEKVWLSADKEYDGSRHLKSVHYTLTLESVYSIGDKVYSFVEPYSTEENGSLFSSLTPVVELSQKLSPKQPITLRRRSYFSQIEIDFLSKQNFILGVKGKRTLKISKKSPGTVIRTSSNLRSAILGPTVGFVSVLALLIIMSILCLKGNTSIQFRILTLIIGLGLFSGCTLAYKFFWTGGKNTRMYDPSHSTELESMTIGKATSPTELIP